MIITDYGSIPATPLTDEIRLRRVGITETVMIVEIGDPYESVAVSPDQLPDLIDRLRSIHRDIEEGK